MLTIRPPRCRIICRDTALVTRKVPFRFVRTTVSKSSSERRMRRLSRVTPALFTRTSIRPCSEITAWTAASTRGASPTSKGDRTPLPPALSIPASTSRAAASLLAKFRTTTAPSEANLSATARPIPRDAPVTSATFPARRIVRNPFSKFIPSNSETVQGKTSPGQAPDGGQVRRRTENRRRDIPLDPAHQSGEDLPRPDFEKRRHPHGPHPAHAFLPANGRYDLPEKGFRHPLPLAVGLRRHVGDHREGELPGMYRPQFGCEPQGGGLHQGAVKRRAHGERHHHLRAGRFRRLARGGHRRRAPGNHDLVSAVEVRRLDHPFPPAVSANRRHGVRRQADHGSHRSLPQRNGLLHVPAPRPEETDGVDEGQGPGSRKGRVFPERVPRGAKGSDPRLLLEDAVRGDAHGEDGRLGVLGPPQILLRTGKAQFGHGEPECLGGLAEHLPGGRVGIVKVFPHPGKLRRLSGKEQSDPHPSPPYIRTRAEPHVSPAPKDARSRRSPFANLPCSRASARAIGTDAAEVFP